MYNKVALKENLTLHDYFNLFEDWNVDRGADGEENGFDLQDYVDFHYFSNCYGVMKALECQKKQRFWIGGNNFPTPMTFPMTIKDAKSFVRICVDEERVIAYPHIYGKYYTYVDRYSPNNNAKHEMEYPVVLQWFTAILYPIVNNYPISDNYYSNDVMDAIANMAYDFHKEYKKTEWETIFMDYLLHFAYNNAEKYFNDIFFNSDIVKIKEDIKSDDFWYE